MNWFSSVDDSRCQKSSESRFNCSDSMEGDRSIVFINKRSKYPYYFLVSSHHMAKMLKKPVSMDSTRGFF